MLVVYAMEKADSAPRAAYNKDSERKIENVPQGFPGKVDRMDSPIHPSTGSPRRNNICIVDVQRGLYPLLLYFVQERGHSPKQAHYVACYDV